MSAPNISAMLQQEYVPEYVRAEVASSEELIVQAARSDPVTFLSYVLRDENTGSPIIMRGVHKQWQRDITNNTRIVIFSHIESGKTQGISIGRTLYEIGKNPVSGRAVIVSANVANASKVTATIGRYIDKSEEFRRVFPDVKPDRSVAWTKTKMTVTGQGIYVKDANIQSVGVKGNIVGTRLTWVVLDDILSYANTATEYLRDELVGWIQSNIFGRMQPGGKIVFVGTAWHADDIMHRLAKQSDVWFARRYPVIDTSNKLTWPERWSPERIEEFRKILTPIEFSRQLMCTAVNDASSRFLMEWIDRCKLAGEGMNLVRSLKFIPAGCKVFTGVDLSTGRHKDKGDKTVLFTILVQPDGLRRILDIQSGRWQAPEIIARINDCFSRYQSTFIVEANVGQEFIAQFASASNKGMKVIPFHTGKNKLDPEHGVESLAVELQMGRWLFPCHAETRTCEPEVSSLIDQLLSFDPAHHTGDSVMAMWLAREGARMSDAKHKVRKISRTVFRR